MTQAFQDLIDLYGAPPTSPGQPNIEIPFSPNDLLEWRGKYNGDRPFLCPLDFENQTSIVYTFRRVACLVRQCSQALALDGITVRAAGEKPVVVAIIGLTSLDIWISQMGLARLGHHALLISSTLPLATTRALLEKANASYLLMEPSISYSAKDTGLKGIPWWSATNADSNLNDEDLEPPGNCRTTLSSAELEAEPFCILHSTGSTSVPKLIPRSRRISAFPTEPLSSQSKLICTSMSHAYANYACHSALNQGVMLYLNPSSDTGISEKLLLETFSICQNNPNPFPYSFGAVPQYFDILARSESQAAVQRHLRTFKALLLAGSPTTADTERWLEKNELPVLHFVSSTETGPIMSNGPSVTSGPQSTSGWKWLMMDRQREPWLIFEPSESGSGQEKAYELVIRAGFPTLCFANRPNGSLATGDLYVRHPNADRIWRFLMRQDDVLVHSTGLATNARFIEDKFNAHPLVRSSLVIGNRREKVAMLVIPSRMGTTKEDLVPLIREVNIQCPSQSHISLERVCVLSADDTFVVSSKGVNIRSKSEDKFRAQIETML